MEEKLKEMLGKRPEELEGETLKLFEAIMKIADERDELRVRNKELEEENESLVRQYEYQGALMVNEYCSIKKVFELFIPKSKIKEIRDKAEVMDYYTLPDVIEDLNKLLKEVKQNDRL